MAFLLGMILAVSLAVTLIGFLLSARPRFRSERAPYRTPAPTTTIARASRRAGGTVGVQRYVNIVDIEETEPRTLITMLQSIQVGRMFGRREGGSVPWTGILVILVALFLLGAYMLNVFLPNARLGGAFFWSPFAQTTSNNSTQPQAPSPITQSLLRISQLDPGQYYSTADYTTWAYSACSSAAMTEVINSYGHHYRIADILKIEAGIGEITPQLGLLEDIGIARTVARFGFATTYMHGESLNDVITVANGGHPVIVSFPPDRYAGGHLVVVTGGDANTVYLADSSLYNRHSLTHAEFMKWWEGFAAIVTPIR